MATSEMLLQIIASVVDLLHFLFGFLLGSVDQVALNVIYNIADFVNKIGFVLSCWTAAKSDSAKKDALLA